jgi:hypothetical protein
MKLVELRFTNPMRDPMGSALRYEECYDYIFERLNTGDIDRYQPGTFARDRVRRASCLYAIGEPIANLIDQLSGDLPFLITQPFSLGLNNREDLQYLSLALLLLPTKEELQLLVGLVSESSDSRLYSPDLLIKAFVPDWKLAKKYPRPPMWTPTIWRDSLIFALAAAPEDRNKLLAAHMKRWNRLMKPYGWKAVRDYSREAAEKRGELERVFPDFAYEAALAACAYDIDDSGFRDHPYYPRELVDYYRANIRHTRDAWRAEGVGANVLVKAPLPVRADLNKSKRKGFARWLELASDGNVDATEAVREEYGNPRKVSNLAELGCVMAEHGISLYTDIKDDDTLLAQLDSLAQDRQLGEFKAPESPANVTTTGHDRCSFLLQTAAIWFQSHGYSLLALDIDNDAWAAVLVRTAFSDEWSSLSERLSIKTSELKNG